MTETFGTYRALTMEERFWRKVEKCGPVPSERPHLGRCWIWTGKIHDHGYGLFTIKSRHLRAHRVAWELHHARPIPDGEIIRHRCDNRACVNPDHLVSGDHSANNADAVLRHRTGVLRGDQNKVSKLTSEAVQWARQQYDSGLDTVAGLARKCGVSPTTMDAAVKRKSWQHIA